MDSVGFWLILAGVMSVPFGVLMFLFPGAGALAVLWIGVFAMFGVVLLELAFRLRGLGRGHPRGTPATA